MRGAISLIHDATCSAREGRGFSLAGSPGHDLYAPCSIKDLKATGFRYWALGHVHTRSRTDGAYAIVMPGMPQGRDVNDAGVKSVTLVTNDEDRSFHVEERATSIAQFERSRSMRPTLRNGAISSQP